MYKTCIINQHCLEEEYQKILLRTHIAESGLFSITGSAVALTDFAWNCFNYALPEHKEPFYFDWDEIGHGLREGCPYFDTFKLEKESRYNEKLLWTTEATSQDFRFDYSLDEWHNLLETQIILPDSLDQLEKEHHADAHIYLQYNKRFERHEIFANSRGWYELGKIVLFVVESPQNKYSVTLTEQNFLYNDSLPLCFQKRDHV